MKTGPLAGVRVVVTRARHQASGLVASFAAAGAQVVSLPLLEVVPPPDPRPLERSATELALYDWLVFTSANAVNEFLPLTGGVLPSRLRVAVVGQATARALSRYDIEPTLVATKSHAEGLVEALAPRIARRRRVLLPQAADARPTLARGLEAAGAEVATVVAYAKRCPPQAAQKAGEVFAEDPLGWVTFTSPSTVSNLAELFGTRWAQRRQELLAVSIGGVTSQALRQAGVEPAAEAATPNDEAMVEAVEAFIEARRREGGDAAS